MFNYPNVTPRQIFAAKHICFKCNKWIDLNPQELKKLNADWKIIHKEGLADWQRITCPHCQNSVGVTCVGKYDRPGASLAKCNVLWVSFTPVETPKSKAGAWVELPAYLTISESAITDYIAVGRFKVLNTQADPYRDLKGRELRSKIGADAKQIWKWFEALPLTKKHAAADQIIAIQHGPSHKAFR